ncbi:MAG: ABC transporter ATP-binding protein [Eubacteriales bacterium]|nr:ABC transporter ATP-binding protein [Eubacteriales bacterium]
MNTTKNQFSWRENIQYVLRAVTKYDKGVYGLFALFTVCGALLPFVGVLLPKVLIGGIEAGNTLPTMLGWAGALAAGGMALAGLSTFASQQTFMRLVFIRMGVINEFSQKIMTMDYVRTEDPAELDRLRLAHSAFWGNQVGLEGVMHILFDNVGIVVSLLGLVAMLTVLHPLILLLLAGGAAASFAFSMRARKIEEGMQGELNQVGRQLDYMNTNVQDFAFGKDIRLYGMKGWLSARFDALIRGRIALEKRLKRAQIPQVVSDGFFTLLREGAVYGYLIYLIFQGLLSVAEFAMYFAAVAAFSAGLNKVLWAFASLRVELKKVDVLHGFMAEKQEERPGIAPPSGSSPGISFQDVSFAYPGGKTVMEHLNLDIRPGEKLAIVGLNGAGKTTLVKLLTRLYEPTQGRIVVGGVPAAEIDREEYFKLFSALFQEVHLFAFSVAENVAMRPAHLEMLQEGPVKPTGVWKAGEGEVDRQRARRALEMAGLWQTVEALPQGMDTTMLKQIELDGVEFSGGQNQRLALARALYKDAPIVVLDEPTAALDPLAEFDLYQKFSDMTREKTAVFISHRLSSTRFCDRIVYLENGAVAEQGTHDELMQKNGKYAALFRVQAQYYQQEAKAHAQQA